MEHILDDISFNNYVVVGVSTGPDSMFLLDLLQKKTNKIIVCHINHNVRSESKKEEEFIREYCKNNNLILEVMKIEDYKENNFENEARKKRYTFYEKILKKYNTDKLFLAHHGDDLIETVLMKIMRGSNIEGYAGIKKISKVKDYYIIRPLLSITKSDIIEYNNSHNIPYFIDSSNKNTDYTRNRYRKNILPILKEENKEAHLKFLKYSQTLLEYDTYIKEVTNNLINTMYKGNTLNLELFAKEKPFIQKNILFRILNDIYDNKDNIVTEKHVNNILSIIKNNKPNLKINMPKNIEITKAYNSLIFSNNIIKSNDYKIKFNKELTINNMHFKEVASEDDDSNKVCRIDSKNILLPLYFRNRKDGDYIILKNSNNRKKIKEIFIEKKLPLKERNTFPILVDSNDNIIWIPNLKKSKFCIKKDGKYDIIIKCNEREDLYE